MAFNREKYGALKEPREEAGHGKQVSVSGTTPVLVVEKPQGDWERSLAVGFSYSKSISPVEPRRKIYMLQFLCVAYWWRNNCTASWEKVQKQVL